MGYNYTTTRNMTQTDNHSILLEEGDVREILRLAKEQRQCEKNLEDIFGEWYSQIEAMDWNSNEFEQILLAYSNHIFRRISFSGNGAVKDGAHNLLCDVMNNGVFSFEQLMAFHKGYGELTRELDIILNEANLGKGDDSYGDFLDSLPLAGLSLADDIANGCFGSGNATDLASIEMNIREVYQEWDTPCFNNEEEWFEFIWEGENYIAFTLWQVLEDRMTSFIHTIAPDELKYEEEE